MNTNIDLQGVHPLVLTYNLIIVFLSRQSDIAIWHITKTDADTRKVDKPINEKKQDQKTLK
jgi:hypothetical protein